VHRNSGTGWTGRGSRGRFGLSLNLTQNIDGNRCRSFRCWPRLKFFLASLYKLHSP